MYFPFLTPRRLLNPCDQPLKHSQLVSSRGEVRSPTLVEQTPVKPHLRIRSPQELLGWPGEEVRLEELQVLSPEQQQRFIYVALGHGFGAIPVVSLK